VSFLRKVKFNYSILTTSEVIDEGVPCRRGNFATRSNNKKLTNSLSLLPWSFGHFMLNKTFLERCVNNVLPVTKYSWFVAVSISKVLTLLDGAVNGNHNSVGRNTDPSPLTVSKFLNSRPHSYTDAFQNVSCADRVCFIEELSRSGYHFYPFRFPFLYPVSCRLIRKQVIGSRKVLFAFSNQPYSGEVIMISQQIQRTIGVRATKTLSR
jgi:hypothetical protein